MAIRNRLFFWPLVAFVTFLFVLGMSGVVYFASEVIHPLNLPGGIAVGIALSNLVSAAAVLTVVVPLYNWRHRQPARQRAASPGFQPITWKTYALIATLTAAVYLLYSIGLIFAYWIPLYTHLAPGTPPPPRPDPVLTLFYYLAPMTAACLLYYWLTRERFQTARFSEQEAQMLKLNELKTKAELEALQAKINPHFLYNALNSIASLTHLDAEKAERMTLLLSKFYRASTAKNDQYFDSIQNELDTVSTYLDVEKVRFDDRLEYQIEYQTPALREARIPRFLIQPVVENAIKHGISKLPGQGCIRIRVEKESDKTLILSIYDNGPPFPETLASGYGLQNIRDKLRLLSGPEAAMELVNSPAKCVRLFLPMRE